MRDSGMFAAARAANTPSSGLRGTLGTLVTRTSSPSSAIRSVNVPPTSTPTRIVCPFSVDCHSSSRLLFELEIERLDDLAPHLGLVGDHLPELGRRHAVRLRPVLDQALADIPFVRPLDDL